MLHARVSLYNVSRVLSRVFRRERHREREYVCVCADEWIELLSSAERAPIAALSVDVDNDTPGSGDNAS